jgi:protein translocase SecG subunit
MLPFPPIYAIMPSMQLVARILPYAEIIFSVVMVLAILLDQSGAEVGGALGGGGESYHHTRRGFQKFLFYLAITSGILFTVSALLSIILK